MYVEKHVNKLYLVVLVCLFLGFNMNVYGYNSHSLEFERIRDVGNNIEDDKNWIFKFIFPNKKFVNIKNDDSPFIFLMIDGGIVPNLNLPAVNNKTYIPLRLLATYLDMNTSWDNLTKTAVISKDDTTVSVSLSHDSSEIKVIDSSIYVSIRFLEKKFPVTVTYRPFIIDENDPFNILLHPLVIIDSDSAKFTLAEQEAIDLAKSELNKAYTNFLTNKKYNTGTKEANNVLNLLKEDIEDISCVNKISRYYILDGPYLTLVDGVTGEIYFLKSKINKSHIIKLDILNPEVFARDYFVG